MVFPIFLAKFVSQHPLLATPLVCRLAGAVQGVAHLRRTQAQHHIVVGVAGEETGGHRLFASQRRR